MADWPRDALRVAAFAPSWWANVIKPGGQLSSLQVGAHDILHEQVDWNAPTWLFDSRQLPRFVATLRRLFKLLPEEFTLLAASGYPAGREARVGWDELLRLVVPTTLPTLCCIASKGPGAIDSPLVGGDPRLRCSRRGIRSGR